MKLCLTRCSEPHPSKAVRRETEIAMFSLYDADSARMFLRSTPWVMEYRMKQMLAKEEIQNTTPVLFVYRHGEHPEGTTVTVQELLGWLTHSVSRMKSARDSIANDAKKKDLH
jgi:hypothetical protein